MKIALKEYIRLSVPTTLEFEGAQYELVGRGPRIGVLVALDDGKWGWSVIAPEENLEAIKKSERTILVRGNEKVVTHNEKVWNAERIWDFGTQIAIGRALGFTETPAIAPTIALSSIRRFKQRMQRYFK